MPHAVESIQLVNLRRRKRMKFSDSLTFNAAPELQGHYLAYDSLKEAIYRFEKQQASQGADVESAALLGSAATGEDNTALLFKALLDKELTQIVSFYAKEESSLLSQVKAISTEIDQVEHSNWLEDDAMEADSDSDADDGPATNRVSKAWSDFLKSGSKKKKRNRAMSNASEENAPPGSISNLPSKRRPSANGSASAATGSNVEFSIWNHPKPSEWATDIKITFKLRLQNLFREISQLAQFIGLNQTGFRKILKKFDKITENSLQKSYMAEHVLQAYPFLPTTRAKLDENLNTVIDLFARVVTRSDKELALKTLKSQLREFVVYERNTIWREMVGLHGRGAGISNQGKVGQPSVPMVTDMTDGKGGESSSHVSAGVDWRSKQVWGGCLGVTVFLILLVVPIMDKPAEQNCLALLALASIFWALEVIPLFVTSLSIPFWVVVLRVIQTHDNGIDKRLSAPDATKYIFSTMFSPTIMLLIGGFTLAAALSKHNIDKMLATRVLSLAGTRPRTVLLAYMGVACFASMWISNVAAPVLCYGLIQPILRTLPTKTDFAKALIIGIALASNIGGQSSPISSPQNLIALEYMNPPVGWLTWFAIALPVSAISVFGIWILLCHSYSWEQDLSINPIRKLKDEFTTKQYFVSVVVICTIVLWCVSHQIDGVFGDMGVIALVPLILFFGTGCLRKSDFENYPWAIVFLAMGGISLGKAVLASGLLDDIDVVIQSAVRGLDIWPILALSSIVCLIIATFVSHTVASVLLVPVAAQIGEAMEQPHPRLLIMATALICSAGMGLPISGFPNMTAINLENDIGVPYLRTNDFLRNGIPSSVLAVSVIITMCVDLPIHYLAKSSS